jgi:hypothetical protein
MSFGWDVDAPLLRPLGLIQCDAIQYYPIQSNPVQSSPVQSSPVQSSPIQHAHLCKRAWRACVTASRFPRPIALGVTACLCVGVGVGVYAWGTGLGMCMNACMHAGTSAGFRGWIYQVGKSKTRVEFGLGWDGWGWMDKVGR